MFYTYYLILVKAPVSQTPHHITRVNSQNGMGILETIVVVFILSLILPTIGSFLWSGLMINRRISGTIFNQRIARHAMDKLTEEIREITFGDNNQYPLQTCGPLEIAFYSDTDLDAQNEYVHYFVSNNQLFRGIINPVGNPATYPSGNEVQIAMIDDVLNDSSRPLFYYYNSTYTGTQSALSQPISCSVARLVEINFVIDTVIERQPGPFELESMVQLRNLKNNL